MNLFREVGRALYSYWQRPSRINDLERINHLTCRLKLDIDFLKDKQRKMKSFIWWCYILVPVAFVYMVLLGDIGWWAIMGFSLLTAIFSLGLGSLLMLCNKLLIKAEQAELEKLKEEKEQKLEEIKTTESYTVAIDMLQKFKEAEGIESVTELLPLRLRLKYLFSFIWVKIKEKINNNNFTYQAI